LDIYSNIRRIAPYILGNVQLYIVELDTIKYCHVYGVVTIRRVLNFMIGFAVTLYTQLVATQVIQHHR
jgi:hypothetical protein